MKLAIAEERLNAWVMTLVPETPAEQQALHDMQYRGVKGTILRGCGTPRQDLELTLGPDYIAQSRQTSNEGRSAPEVEKAVLNTHNETFGV